jgi:hypothetical protein
METTIEDLLRAFRALPRGHRGAPHDLRQEVANFARTQIARGWSTTSLAAELRIPHSTLCRWMRLHPAASVVEAEPVEPDASLMRPVLVGGTLTLGLRAVHMPSQVAIEGLDMSALIALLQALS